jgi:hypothetical protein
LSIKSKLTATIAVFSITLFTSLAGVGASSANAATPSLSLTELQATQGYADLSAASAKSLTYLSTLQGLNQKMTINETYSGITMTITSQIAATRSTAVAEMVMSNSLYSDTQTIDYAFSNQHYLMSLESLQQTDAAVTNLSSALARLGKPRAVQVDTGSSAVPSDFLDITPSTLFSPQSQDLLNQTGALVSEMLFSEVTSAPSTNDPQSTTFSYDAQATIAAIGSKVDVSISITFNADGFLSAMTLTEQATSIGLQMNISLQQTAANSLQIDIPTSALTVDQTQLVAMSHKIDAEKSVTSKANAIAAKAKTLAKKAKVALSAPKLVAAAKALKAKYSTVKNGVKLTSKSSGVSGSMCVTAVKGKVTVKHC